MKKKKEKMKPDFIVYTDGGCAVNPGGPGGIGAVIIDANTGTEWEISKGYFSTTNNRMEMRAVIEALSSLPKKCSLRLYSDSQYVINCMSGAWQKKKNTDLWRTLDALQEDRVVELRWVRGHNGDKYNERCDTLATEAIKARENHVRDEGYEGRSRNEKSSGNSENKKTNERTPGGAMAVDITIPADYPDKAPCMCSPKEYSERTGIHTECAKGIVRFYALEKKSFNAYAGLRTDGFDKYSRKSESMLIQEMKDGEEAMRIIRENLGSGKEAVSALRWHARGLTIKDCIRKVLVDAEIRANMR